MELFGYKVERLSNEDWEFNFKLTKDKKTVYLIKSLGRLLPVDAETGVCGKLNGVLYFTERNGELVPD